jgi:hypothetical protein
LGVPAQLLQAIHALYQKCRAYILFGGDAEQFIDMQAGIKQGCPASGSIFALALDPFLRKLLTAIPRQLGTLAAFADDIAAVVPEILAFLTTIAPMFSLFAQASGLRLNPQKTIIIPIGKLDPSKITAHIAEHIASWREIKLARAGKLLGVMLGPESATTRWAQAGEKYWTTSRASKASAGGFWQALRHYRVFAFSVLCHLAQFADIPQHIARMENLALQGLTKSPFNTFPSPSINTLCNIGAPLEAPSLAAMNTAALVRNATTSQIFFCARHRYQNDESDEEALIVRRPAEWASSSVVLCTEHAYERVIALPIDIDSLPSQGFQRALVATLRARVPDPWHSLLHRRLIRWFSAVADPHVQRLLTNIRVAFSTLPQSAVMAWLRVVLNGIPTSARMQGGRASCLFCGWGEGDRVEHMVHCPSLANFVRNQMPQLASWEGPVARPLAVCLQFPASSLQLLRETIVFGDVLYHTHRHIRHGSRCRPEELAQARVRYLAVRFGLRLI